MSTADALTSRAAIADGDADVLVPEAYYRVAHHALLPARFRKRRDQTQALQLMMDFVPYSPIQIRDLNPVVV